MDTIVSLCKRRGFIFQSSEIYGGLGSAWDYGPLGAELKRNVKNLWWRDNVQRRHDMVGIDAAITMHPTVWEASGHRGHFADPYVGCTQCARYFRADHVEDALKNTRWFEPLTAADYDASKYPKWRTKKGLKQAENLPEAFDDVMKRREEGKLCPACGGLLSDPKPADLMLEIALGPVRETATVTWLRPETAQGIFVNFDNVLQASRKKLPFGIAQVGKSFRNEVTPGNFIFRTREFEQMEIEFFCKPGTDEEWHQKWIDERFAWYQKYGVRKENLKIREHAADELAHYAKRCVDIEYNFPMGWSELEGIANRTDFDLKAHSEKSGKKLEYFDTENNEKIVPYVIEPSGGADRGTLAFLIDAYHEEVVRDAKRVVLKFHREVAPIKVAVLPLLKKNPKIVETAKALCDKLNEKWVSVYDDTAAIGKLYRRQDEVGTPYCVTVDVETVGDEEKAADNQVTVRDRDSMDQTRVPIEKLPALMDDLMTGVRTSLDG